MASIPYLRDGHMYILDSEGNEMRVTTEEVTTRVIHAGSLYEVTAVIGATGTDVDGYQVQRLHYLNQPEGPREAVGKGHREAYQIEDKAWHLSSLQSLIDVYHRLNLIY